MKPFLPRSEQTYKSGVDERWKKLQTDFDTDQSQFFKSDTFNPAHSESLKTLRDAQIALAKAWTTEDQNEQVVNKPAQELHSEEKAQKAARPEGIAKGGSDGLGDGSTSHVQDPRESDFDQWRDPEEETQSVIALARRRREKNDEDFKRAENSLSGLISKLDAVTEGMNKVHTESLKMWGTDPSQDDARASDPPVGN